MIKVETYEQDGHRIYRSSIQGRLPDIIYDAALILSGTFTMRWTERAMMTRRCTGNL